MKKIIFLILFLSSFLIAQNSDKFPESRSSEQIAYLSYDDQIEAFRIEVVSVNQGDTTNQQKSATLLKLNDIFTRVFEKNREVIRVKIVGGLDSVTVVGVDESILSDSIRAVMLALADTANNIRNSTLSSSVDPKNINVNGYPENAEAYAIWNPMNPLMFYLNPYNQVDIRDSSISLKHLTPVLRSYILSGTGGGGGTIIPFTANPPLYYNNDQIGLHYSTKNFYLLGGYLNTIQDISKSSTPEFLGALFTSHVHISSWSKIYGTNWSIDYSISTPNQSTMSIDNLYVNKYLYASTFVKKKVSATNGAVYVTQSAVVDSVFGTSVLYIKFEDPDNDKLIPFEVGDLLFTTIWKNNGTTLLREVKATVVGKVDNIATVTYQSTARPQKGDVLVRVGNTGLANRRSLIYMSTDDAGSPFIKFYSGIKSWTYWDNKEQYLVTAMGRLDGINDPFLGVLSGNGFFGENAYLKGKFYLQSGTLGDGTNIDISGNATFVSLATDVNGNYSLIQQNISAIDLKVGYGEIINSINISTEGININAQKVGFNDGNAYFSNTASFQGFAISDNGVDLIKLGDFTGSPSPVSTNYNALLGGGLNNATDKSYWSITGSLATYATISNMNQSEGSSALRIEGLAAPIKTSLTMEQSLSNVTNLRGKDILISFDAGHFHDDLDPSHDTPPLLRFSVLVNGQYAVNQLLTDYLVGDYFSNFAFPVQIPSTATTVTVRFYVVEEEPDDFEHLYLDNVKVESYEKVFFYVNQEKVDIRTSDKTFFVFNSSGLNIGASSLTVNGYPGVVYFGKLASTDTLPYTTLNGFLLHGTTLKFHLGGGVWKSL